MIGQINLDFLFSQNSERTLIHYTAIAFPPYFANLLSSLKESRAEICKYTKWRYIKTHFGKFYNKTLRIPRSFRLIAIDNNIVPLANLN